MSALLYAAYTRDGKQESRIFHSYDDYFAETFNPDTDLLSLIDFRLYGKSYSERKISLENIAIEFQAENLPGLSYGEMSEIYDFFERNARRYGLQRTFEMNGII